MPRAGTSFGIDQHGASSFPKKISKGLNSKFQNYLFGKIAYNVSGYAMFAVAIAKANMGERNCATIENY